MEVRRRAILGTALPDHATVGRKDDQASCPGATRKRFLRRFVEGEVLLICRFPPDRQAQPRAAVNTSTVSWRSATRRRAVKRPRSSTARPRRMASANQPAN